MATTRKDTAALSGVQDRTPDAPAPRRFFLSEGVRQDLEIHGKAVDPATGALLTRDPDTGEVTVKPRP